MAAGIISNIKQNYKTLKQPESGDFLHLDLLRFIAAMGVVFFHFHSSIDFGAYKDLEIIRNKFSGLTVLVDMFFMISGFIIFALYGDKLNNLKSYRLFLKKRIARLLPLHWLTLAFVLATYWLRLALGVTVSSPESYSCVTPNIFLIHSFGLCDDFTLNGVSWSISAEMGMYLIAPLLIFLTLRKPKIAAFIAFAVIMALFLVPSPTTKSWLDWAYDYGVIRAVPSFMLGMVLFKVRSYLGFIPKPSLLFMLFVVLFFAIQPIAPKSIILLVGYCVVIMAAAADYSREIPKIISSSAWLGKLTYSIYMLHQIAYIMAVQSVGVKVLHLTGTAINLWILFCIIGLIIFSAISLMYFEMPMRKWVVSIGATKK